MAKLAFYLSQVGAMNEQQLKNFIDELDSTDNGFTILGEHNSNYSPFEG